jgi:hypothetical protein
LREHDGGGGAENGSFSDRSESVSLGDVEQEQQKICSRLASETRCVPGVEGKPVAVGIRAVTPRRELVRTTPKTAAEVATFGGLLTVTSVNGVSKSSNLQTLKDDNNNNNN